ncbi:MAG: hypothetical protein Q7R83_03705 [bacterium]|nr:hypothetical protein [bacterium]
MPSKIGSVARFVMLDLVGSVIHFPLWWYTEGLASVLRWVQRALAFRWKSFSIAVWVKNLFVPMYGQYDFVGRIISVFMRFVILIGRLIFIAFEAVFYFVLILFWVALLPGLVFLFVFGVLRGVFLPPPSAFVF